MERYLSLKNIPKKPRWREVTRTAYYVLSHCSPAPALKQQLENSLNQLLHLVQQGAFQWSGAKQFFIYERSFGLICRKITFYSMQQFQEVLDWQKVEFTVSFPWLSLVETTSEQPSIQDLFPFADTRLILLRLPHNTP